MGLLNNSQWNEAVRRTIAKSTVPCEIVEVKELPGKPDESGKSPKDTTRITLRFLKDAKTIDNDTIAVGGTVDVMLNTAPNTNGDSKLEQMNRISQERFRELVVSALRLPVSERDPHGKMTAAGGADALKGKQVIVDFSPSSQGMNSVARFSAVAAP